MKIQFLGIKNSSRKSGCSSCSSRRVSSYGFQREKTMIFPTGLRKTFIVGQIYEVAEADGLFLLAQSYELNGVKEKMFTKVMPIAH